MKVLAFVVALILCHAPVAGAPPAQAAPVTGPDLTRVDYGPLSGTGTSGFFERVDAKNWIEKNPGGTNRFTVEKVDAQHVHLRKSDGARIELDLAKRVVKVNGRDFFRVTKASGAVAVTGESLARVDYGPLSGTGTSGFFERVDAKNWVEKNRDGTHRFTVEKVDAQHVHLRKTDGARLELDLAKRVIKINGGDLYRITKATGGSAVPVPVASATKPAASAVDPKPVASTAKPKPKPVPPAPTRVVVRINDIDGTSGLMRIALYANAGGWAKDMDSEKTQNHVKYLTPRPSGSSMTVSFDVEPGQYAVSLYHDEDNDGEIDKFLGIPTEDYGFSRNFNPVSARRAPHFNECEFSVARGQTVTQQINLR